MRTQTVRYFGGHCYMYMYPYVYVYIFIYNIKAAPRRTLTQISLQIFASHKATIKSYHINFARNSALLFILYLSMWISLHRLKVCSNCLGYCCCYKYHNFCCSCCISMWLLLWLQLCHYVVVVVVWLGFFLFFFFVVVLGTHFLCV